MNIRSWVWENVKPEDSYTLWIQQQWSSFKKLFGDSLTFSHRLREADDLPLHFDPRTDQYSPHYADHLNYRYHERFDQWLCERHNLCLTTAKKLKAAAISKLESAPLSQSVLSVLENFDWDQDPVLADSALAQSLLEVLQNVHHLVSVCVWIKEHTRYTARVNYRRICVELTRKSFFVGLV
jgi:hypothetical protein